MVFLTRAYDPPALPEIRAADYNITAFGAKPDGKTDAKAAIMQAIAKAHSEGGGRIVCSGGTFFVKGPIQVNVSHINLFIDEGSTLKFSGEPSDYLPVVLTRFEGTVVYNYSPLIYAPQISDFAITGSGTLDGSGSHEFAKWSSKEKGDQNRLRDLGNNTVPWNQRIFGSGHYLRPSMIQPFNTSTVLIEGVTVKDSPFWVIHPTFCSNVTVRGVHVDSKNANNDGCDPDSCTDVLIADSSFNSGDDCISVKSGRDADAWKIGRPSEHIRVQNIKCSTGANGFCVGSEMSGGVQDVSVENFTCISCGNAIEFKANKDRGAYIKDVTINNMHADKCKGGFVVWTNKYDTNSCVIMLNALILHHYIMYNSYHGARGGDDPTAFTNFSITNSDCKDTGTGIDAGGLSEKHIQKAIFVNVTVVKAAKALDIENVDEFVFEHVTINGEPQKSPGNSSGGGGRRRRRGKMRVKI
jgi:polygalacturonase